MPLFEYEGVIILVLATLCMGRRKGSDATSHTMTFTKQNTIKLSIKMTG